MFWIQNRSLYKIFLSIKKRHQKYWTIGLSRHEWEKFWLTEMKLRVFIDKLRHDGKLIFIKKTRCTRSDKYCNIYQLSQEFIDFLSSVHEYVKKEIVTYTPDDVLDFVRTFAKKKSTQWVFDRNWIKYVVNERWRYRGKILDTQNMKIVSLLSF